jgi:valyl-tRNA synthetase
MQEQTKKEQEKVADSSILSLNYDFKEAEKRLLNFWLKEKIFKFDSKSKKKIYSIDTPPPYISGKMHIGHAFGYSQQDFIARFRRMAGENVFYPFGTDDNGLPTEKFVEKTNNVKSKQMTRADFINLCIKTLKETTNGFIQDWKDIGVSADFERYYSTIDKPTQKLSQKSFIDLFKKKEAYSQEFPTLWCCECQTAIAQAELEDKEQQTLFSTLKFSCEGKDLLIATTRPELLGACVAVFVNPADSRYKKLIGKKAKVPLFNHEVPIIADESAQIDKGTGVLMICSYGDKYDAASINKHKLNPKIILNLNGTLNVKGYDNLHIKAARKKILEDLKNANLIVEQKAINHVVNVHDRCGMEIEVLPTKQWFIKILDKKQKLIEQAKKINWHPEFMFKRYENWVNGLEWDWNISRNRHFGVPIPVWECPKCKEIILPEERELPVDPLQTKKKCSKCKVEAVGENMVFDTWATSSITPQIVSSLSDDKVSIPLSLRPQGHDIIRTWAFYTIVKSYLHEKEIPWKDIIVSGNVSLGGEKMSKSKGNIIEPRVVLDNFGADALRYWAASSKLGEDLDYQEKDLVTGKKFVNKLWNASKFVFMNLGEYNGKKPKKLQLIDQLFLDELNKIINSATRNFSDYEYSKVKLEVDSFFWKNFCDNYMEIVKYRVYNGTEEEKESAKYVLYNSLFSIVKMMAPITPFICEEVYQKFFKVNEKEKSIHISSWPAIFSIKQDKGTENIWAKFVEVLENVRKAKSEAKKSMKAEINLSLEKKDYELLKNCLLDLQAVSCAKEIRSSDKFIVDFL